MNERYLSSTKSIATVHKTRYAEENVTAVDILLFIINCKIDIKKKASTFDE